MNLVEEKVNSNQVVADKYAKLVPYIAPMKGEQTVYILLNQERDRDPHNRGRLLVPSQYNVASRFQILGNDGHTLVPVKYSIGQMVNERTGQYEDVYTEINFQMGQKIVSKYEPDLYVVMELHPENEDNPYRDKRIPATFKKLNVEGDKAAEYDKEEALFDALAKFRGEQNISKIATFARAIGVNANQDAKAIKWDCLQRLKNDPKLIELFGTTFMRIKAAVQIAFEGGILEFNQITTEIGYKRGHHFTKIVAVPMGTPGDLIKDFFASWLKNDQTGVLDSLLERLELEGYGDEIYDEEEDRRLREAKLAAEAEKTQRFAPDNRIFQGPPTLTDSEISANVKNTLETGNEDDFGTDESAATGNKKTGGKKADTKKDPENF